MTASVATVNRITYLDGIRLHRALIAGIREVIARQDYLNKINLFPVPDRDTGTNMALTLNAVIEGTYTFYKPEINNLLDRVADSALNGARGNSGAILAQFFQGVSEGAQEVHKKMTTKNFVVAIANGVNLAYKAVSQPQEGTILTVLRDFSDELTKQQLIHDDIDFVELYKRGLDRAQESLITTSKQIKSLRKAGVVDAGAQGIVDFFSGIYEFILNGSIDNLNPQEMQPVTIATPEEDLKLDINEKYQFCTECLIVGDSIDHGMLRADLDELGNCLIVAGSKKKTKIHIHVNDPTKVFDICRQQGQLTGEKADDMIHQQKSFNHREGSVAILTDSAADFTDGMIAELDIHVAPLLINFGKKTFLDKVSMTPVEFYHELTKNAEHPKTSQPSFGDFHRQYQYLNSHYESTIAIHLLGGVSGTLNASQTAAKKSNTENNITVVDSKNLSAGLGLIVRYAAEAAKQGLSKAEILAAVQRMIPRTHSYVIMSDLNYAVRGGRLSNRTKLIADMLRITPVIGVKNDDKLGIEWPLLGRQNIPQKFVKKLKKRFDPAKYYRITVMHANNKRRAKTLRDLLKTTFPHLESPIDVIDCGPALGAHAGPGAVGIGIQEFLPITPKGE